MTPPVRRAAVLLCLAVLAAGCAPAGPDAAPYEGLWRSEGFGLYLDVDGNVDVYEHTSISCALVASGSSRGSGEILGLLGDGRLLLSETGRTIYFDRVEVLPARCADEYSTDDPLRNFDVVVATMAEHYADFGLRDPDWLEAVAGPARRALGDGDGAAALLEAITGILGPLGDAQVRLSGPGDLLLPGGTWSADPAPGYVAALSDRILAGDVPGVEEVESAASGGVVAGWFEGGVGYLAVTRLAGFGDEPAAEEDALADALFDQLSRLSGAGALVVDLRTNRGGRESLAMLVASRFVAAETLVATRTVRVGGTTRYVDGGDLVARPLPAGPFPARLVVLVGPGTAGAAETLALALREVPGAVLVGAPTAGSLSPMLLRELPNGWTLGLSHQRVVDADGRSWEGSGIPVDHVVDEEPEAGRDPVLERALEVLGSS